MRANRTDSADSMSGKHGRYAGATLATHVSTMPPVRPTAGRVLSAILGVIAELLITAAIIIGGYIAWQLWWTGAQAEAVQVDQRNAVQWIAPQTQSNRSYSIAKPQQGDIPVQPASANYGDMIAQLYIPRFGKSWQRNVVEGTDITQLNRHGVGHYEDTQMPGQMGNFAIAGHRAGYGEPLAHVDELQKGDAIIVRTKDYWYVYEYTNFEIVTPDTVQVVAAVPNHPDIPADNRYITMTTCEPRYANPTHRWISYGKLKYWAKVSDGVPQELADTADSGNISFSSSAQTPVTTLVTSMKQVIVALAIAFCVLYLAALLSYRFPALRAIREGRRRKPIFSLYGALYRHLPGVAVVRIALMLVLACGAFFALMEWGYPWAASTIPYLQVASNFVAVG